MKHNFTKILALVALFTCSLTAFADTALVSMLLGENGTQATKANSITGAAGSLAEGFTVDMPDNTTKTLDPGGVITYNTQEYTSIKNSNGQRVRIQLPAGKEAQSVTLYMYTNSSPGKSATLAFNGVATGVTIPAESSNTNPTEFTKTLENETAFDFTCTGDQICFIAIITYRDEPTVDPTNLYIFGYDAAVVDAGDTHTISALTLHNDGCDNVTTGDLSATYGIGNSKTVYHGTSTQFTAASAYRSMMGGSTNIDTQDAAENNGAYIGYTLTIAEDYSLAINQISTDIFNAKNDLQYEYVIQNSNDVVLYKSPVRTIPVAQSGNHCLEDRSDAARALNDLTGTIKVKLIFWSSSNTEYIAPSEFYVTGVVTYTGGTTALDNTNADSKAIKVIRNGQPIIIRDGVEFNALGNRL